MRDDNTPAALSDDDRERRAREQAGAGVPSRQPHQARSIARRAQERPGVQACTKDEEEGRGVGGGERRGLQEAQEAQGIGGGVGRSRCASFLDGDM